MKKMSLIVSLFLSLSLTLLSLSSMAIDNLVTDDTVKLIDNKVYAKVSVDQKFADDRVLVVMDGNVGSVNKTYSKGFFEDIDVESIVDLTEIQETLTVSKDEQNSDSRSDNYQTPLQVNDDTFRQILQINLSKKDKKNVINTIKQLEEIEGIVYAGPDYICGKSGATPTDINYNNQWALPIIQAPGAWDITTGSTDVYVGVIDSGISNHIDLSTNLVAGYDFVNENSYTYDDYSGHGTHVAGVIGATANNSEGMAGLSWKVSIVPLQIGGDDDEIITSATIKAITYATNNGIKILNHSWWGYENDFALKTAICNYPGLYICIAGNSGENLDMNHDYPASFNCSNMISVANSDSEDVLYPSSNYGASTVHLAAPGTSIYSCVPGDRYEYWTGTSMAAPHVAGVAALIMSLRPDLSPTEVKALILNNVDHVEALEGKCITEGRLNAYKAVRAATESQTLMGDVNGDGRSDMILSRNISGKRALTVFLGKSNGGFTEPITTNSTRTYIYYDPVFTGDFNGEGLCDILIHWRDYDTHKRRFLVYTSRGDGTFNDAVQLSCALSHEPLQYPCTFHVDDVNGDGKDDFIIVMKNGSGNYSALVYKGTSASPYLIDTSAYAVQSTKVYNSSNQVFTGDFNGDGRADVLVYRSTSTDLNVDGTRQMMVYVGKTDGTFNESETINTNRPYDLATYPSKCFVADVLGNGRDDFIVHYKNDYGNRCNTVYWGTVFSNCLIDTGADALVSTNRYTEDNAVFVGDITGDGRADMIVHGENNGKRQLLVYVANADRTYSEGINTTTINSYNPAQYDDMYFVEDVNGDGRDDFVVKWKNYNGVVCLLTYLGTANGTFSAAVRTEPTTAIPYYS